MKCTRCHGTGKMIEWVATDTVSEYEFPCRKCNGTGEIEVTNEDWLGQMTLNEKAKFLKEISFCCNTCSPEQFEAYKNGKFKCPLKMACATANGFEDWLKEKHNG